MGKFLPTVLIVGLLGSATVVCLLAYYSYSTDKKRAELESISLTPVFENYLKLKPIQEYARKDCGLPNGEVTYDQMRGCADRYLGEAKHSIDEYYKMNPKKRKIVNGACTEISILDCSKLADYELAVHTFFGRNRTMNGEQK